MRNKIVFGVVLALVCIAIWLFFYLIMGGTGELMYMNVFSGIIFAIVLGVNLLVVSKYCKATVKNTATLYILSIGAGVLFLWTLFLTCFLYSKEENDFDLLYEGYLVIAVIIGILFLMADRGGSIAQSHSDEVQKAIDYKSSFLTRLRSAQLRLASLDPDSFSDANVTMSQCVSLLQSTPNRRLNAQVVNETGLEAAIDELFSCINKRDIPGIQKNLTELENIITVIK